MNKLRDLLLLLFYPIIWADDLWHRFNAWGQKQFCNSSLMGGCYIYPEVLDTYRRENKTKPE